jgi:hypothetical protein
MPPWLPALGLGVVLLVMLLSLVAMVVEIRRLGDLLEAVNHAIERVAVTLKTRKP